MKINFVSRWQFGAVLPPEVKLNMCEPEAAYFR